MFGSEQTWRCIGGWKHLVNLFNYIHQMSFVYRFFLFPTLEIGSPCVDFHLNYCHFFFPAGGYSRYIWHISAIQLVESISMLCFFWNSKFKRILLHAGMVLICAGWWFCLLVCFWLTLLSDKVWILRILFVVHSLPQTGESWKHGFMLAVKWTSAGFPSFGWLIVFHLLDRPLIILLITEYVWPITKF